ncbi:related to Cell cycle control protein cwf5 [Melanopsichium pennsylvanicum]|uniref:Related to Cell cycle control protein cwf5 n=2 Tax=Melanopsichium pennsylvanicum TaxID=63383 RepID=A0AAJ4XL13_9BASI|nr:related to Pre-mRNA-splicing factor RBM22 [Melanopsichium pennsylvanicum 4]SNX84063.1 related to Cell cycle control protein cwf5 [Melanopsichium pennsylvanicum]
MAFWQAHGKLGSSGFAAESAETPILCESCLGPNPYIRMTKDSQGKICKVCTRPFTVFRWNPGAGGRFKKTEICTTCAKVKNVCQTCILDLQYGLPVQVRDAALGVKTGGPSSDKNREYYAEKMDRALEGPKSGMDTGRAGQELLRKVGGRKEIEYKADRPDRKQQLCSAFAKGSCPRGDQCPYKHELPANLSQTALPATSSPSSTQPSLQLSSSAAAATTTASAASAASVPRTIGHKLSSATGLPPPQDQSIVSIFISSLPPNVTESELRSFFLSLDPRLRPDHIRSITLVSTSRCAFVNFHTRQQVEWAAAQCSTKMLMGDTEVRVIWGRSRPMKNKDAANSTGK